MQQLGRRAKEAFLKTGVKRNGSGAGRRDMNGVLEGWALSKVRLLH